MNLLELQGYVKGVVTQINKYNHECRMHGIKSGVSVAIIYQYIDIVVVVINDRETVTIPKEIAKYITVEAIK